MTLLRFVEVLNKLEQGNQHSQFGSHLASLACLWHTWQQAPAKLQLGKGRDCTGIGANSKRSAK